jgi:hypothetical protein
VTYAAVNGGTAGAATTKGNSHPTVSTRAAAADGWTGTWAVAAHGSGATYSQKTFREIVHTSIGGTSARIRLSNAFGSRPLAMTDVHIARSAGGSSTAVHIVRLPERPVDHNCRKFPAD